MSERAGDKITSGQGVGAGFMKKATTELGLEGWIGSMSTRNEQGEGNAEGSCRSRGMGKGTCKEAGKSELAARGEAVNRKDNKVEPYA